MPPNTPKPCSECPFRKIAAAGWIGGHKSIEEIIDLVEAGVKFPCHTHVNKIMEEHGSKFEQASQSAVTCVGSLAYIANTEQAPHPYIALQASVIGKQKDCFGSRQEMCDHHNRKDTKCQDKPKTKRRSTNSKEKSKASKSKKIK